MPSVTFKPGNHGVLILKPDMELQVYKVVPAQPGSRKEALFGPPRLELSGDPIPLKGGKYVYVEKSKVEASSLILKNVSEDGTVIRIDNDRFYVGPEEFGKIECLAQR